MIVERKGRFSVRMYAGAVDGREQREWLGTYSTRAEAEEVEALARAGFRGQARERAAASRTRRKSQSVRVGREEARALFPAEPCEICGEQEIDRHHRDGNPLNNERENIVFLCNRHHRQAHQGGLAAEALRYVIQATDFETARAVARAAIRSTEKLSPVAAWDGDE